MTDQEINEAAAVAMGWKHVRMQGDGGFIDYGHVVGTRPGSDYTMPLYDRIPTPATDLNDAAAFAEWWRVQDPDDREWELGSEHDGFRGETLDTFGTEIVEIFMHDPDHPARALSLAVLKAMETPDGA